MDQRIDSLYINALFCMYVALLIELYVFHMLTRAACLLQWWKVTEYIYSSTFKYSFDVLVLPLSVYILCFYFTTFQKKILYSTTCI